MVSRAFWVDASIAWQATSLLAAIALLAIARLIRSRVRRRSASAVGYEKPSSQLSGAPIATTVAAVSGAFASLGLANGEEGSHPRKRGEEAALAEMERYRQLFHKLQNLECYPEILPEARDLLIAMFSETFADAHNRRDPGILAIDRYTKDSLEKFLRDADGQTTQRWEEYLARRKQGASREMFADRSEAVWWLRRCAPVKYVDGAWLGHINKITTPFAARRTTKDAWQVLSEELGDGDLEKNHVYVYRKLLQTVAPDIPEGDSSDFIDHRHGIDQPHVWKAAVSQLLISLFPHEFLPEILGFNMHFELLTLETLMAARELEELKFDAYYFILHVTIDNADSGHTAIAMQAVVGYLEHVRRTEGEEAAERAWRRVQIGYAMSAGLPTAPVCPSQQCRATVARFPRTRQEAEVVRIFKAKVLVASKIHCGSRLRIGGKALVDWLDPVQFESEEWQMTFLDALAEQRPWVRRGDSANSKLVQELSWGGRMFGSFTHKEIAIVEAWIDSLGKPNPRAYWSFTNRPEVNSRDAFDKRDVRVDYPVFDDVQSPATADLCAAELSRLGVTASASAIPEMGIQLKPDARPLAHRLLPLWFVHPCLLESFICTPYKATTASACAIVRLLRAQSGFGAEGPGVDGMDEVRRTESVGLVELGLEMCDGAGLPRPESMKDALERWPSDFGLYMLRVSMRPFANSGLLMGMAWAFAGLHEAVAAARLLSPASTAVLAQMARREKENIVICWNELEGKEEHRAEFWRGYCLGRREIRVCFD